MSKQQNVFTDDETVGVIEKLMATRRFKAVEHVIQEAVLALYEKENSGECPTKGNIASG